MTTNTTTTKTTGLTLLTRTTTQSLDFAAAQFFRRKELWHG